MKALAKYYRQKINFMAIIYFGLIAVAAYFRQ